jgi:RecA-family ATPase
MGVTIDTFQFCPVKELERQAVGQEWLIDSLWGKSAVGLIGGQPKCCKSWLGLDMAISVASATPCMGKFQVKSPGPVLVFLAEDGCAAVRNRIEAICSHRGLDINLLDLYAITEQTIRLDLAGDQQRLEATLKTIRPKLLVLDPLVRLHCGDENSAADISLLLGFLRQLQRTYNTAIVLVHHASKKHRAQPGQALRGSSDLHAFGDSNAYLTRKDDRIVLTLEHRSAKPLDPFDVQLISNDDGSATHLEVVANQTSTTPSLLAVAQEKSDKIAH